ncbi:dethiobiotin synthase [Dickeya solani]|uniref:ATP-dependent dethiobiotin synthetase BioD n=1 Tax=Dickeya solani D s0432-1 TaxID=1231725 RepID=A0AAV3KD27_9GAMM|nr:dethiobiotin synthase [Dickeya solani]ANE76989.1 dethiobiotin synthase [Dickeya solani IPO 2222]AUC44733.1 Dethiobiotin synthetase [Dickeya solani RNS 08.23.3.1.A]AUH07601.1 dethiobiotin synthase [Dickeya solani D s0432-1]AYQ47545.1 ATP-dependent dethiobiotin synthetase BioD 1 [Dickeya solani]AYQ51717.1 ATP-dependent dethiobiotin synthetase BioD 1 [Dickeya solani]
MTERWFVTGTDTEVGKTVASVALLQAARHAGYRTAGYKPVASGCEVTPHGIRNGDALQLQANSSVTLPYDAVNPLAFLEPTSPHIVSAAENRPIAFSTLSGGLRALERQADWVLVEGAGGWFTPLSGRHTFADWVREETLPVILVVGVKLGCINHAMLTAQAVQQAGLRLAGWVANVIQPPGRHHHAYLQTLQERIPAPLLGEIPHLSEPIQQDIGDYLNITLLRG